LGVFSEKKLATLFDRQVANPKGTILKLDPSDKKLNKRLRTMEILIENTLSKFYVNICVGKFHSRY